MLWGFAGPWYGEFLRDENGGFPRTEIERLERQLNFLLKYGLECTVTSLNFIAKMTEEEREWLGNFLTKHNLSLVLHVGYDYINANAETVKSETERIIKLLNLYAPLTRAPLVVTTAHAGHRFDRRYL